MLVHTTERSKNLSKNMETRHFLTLLQQLIGNMWRTSEHTLADIKESFQPQSKTIWNLAQRRAY